MSDLAIENKRRSAILLGVNVALATALIAAILVLVGLAWIGVFVAAAVAGLLGAAAYFTADAAVLRTCRARPADPETHARLHNLVEGLCIVNGLTAPSLYVVDDPVPNAFAAGRSPRHANLAVTTGLLDLVTRVELEAVLAHQLSQIKSNDIAPATLAASVLGWPLAIGGLRHRMVDSQRSGRADRAAVSMTRFPPGLIGALEQVTSHPGTLDRVPRACEHLWFAPMLTMGKQDSVAAVPAPVRDRLAVLREL
ncbi:zinc metalloprotease HtpX [soil metagenome]